MFGALSGDVVVTSPGSRDPDHRVGAAGRDDGRRAQRAIEQAVNRHPPPQTPSATTCSAKLLSTHA
jgi:hypothetical protein